MAKGMYIGVKRDPVPSTQIDNLVLTPSNISNYADVSNSTYYFQHNSDGYFVSVGADSKTATTSIDFEKLAETYSDDTIFTLKYEWSVSSEEGYDQFTFQYSPHPGDTTKLIDKASGEQSGSGTCLIYTDSYLRLQYKKDSSWASGSDQAKIKFTLTGGKPAVPGGTFAQRVVGMYIGVNGVARRVKRAYIGVNDIARCFWAAPGLHKVTSTITNISPARDDLNAGSIGNYALYANGGRSGLTVNDLPAYLETNTCEYYNTSLTKSTASTTVQTARYSGVASNSSYLFIAGGEGNYAEYDGSTVSYTYPTFNTVTRYNTSMTRSTGTSLTYSAGQICSVSTPNYAVFAGGQGDTYLTTMNYYNTSGTRSTGTALVEAKSSAPGAAAGSCPIFAGGLTFSGIPTASATGYNSSLTRTSISALSFPRESLAACSVGNYAIFYCGYNGAAVATVDAYNSSLTKVNVPQGFRAAYGHMYVTTSDNKYALFAGGMKSGSECYTTIEAYDSNLTKTLGPKLNSFRWNGILCPTGCSIMNKVGSSYIVIAGGETYDAENIFGTEATTAEALQYIA